jgi:hypothetical protein
MAPTPDTTASIQRAARYIAAFDWNLYTIPGGYAVASNQESPQGFYAEVKTPDAAIGAFNRHYFAAHI